ncbi:MAG TPA: hypothetical protein VFL42_14710, partial [Terriglobales bacterium]|nr:hypothetical protein [Terriglobales bacterium]
MIQASAQSGSAPQQQVQAPATTREDRWRADLKFFAEQFPQAQMDFGKLYPGKSFHRELGQLEQELPQLSDSEVIFRFMRLVASARVAHNTVYWPEGALAFHSYPLQMAWYSDGLAVIAAGEEYKAALGTRVVRIGTMTPEQLESAVATYIAHENLPWLQQLSPSFMVKQEVAAHFGLAAQDGSIELTLAKAGTAPFRLRVAPLAPGTHPNVVSVFDELHIPQPLYRKQPAANYWYEYLPESHTLFIQYNRCSEDPKKPFKDFADELFRITDDQGNAVQRVVVDLRFNQGGDSSVVKPLVYGLR